MNSNNPEAPPTQPYKDKSTSCTPSCTALFTLNEKDKAVSQSYLLSDQDGEFIEQKYIHQGIAPSIPLPSKRNQRSLFSLKNICSFSQVLVLNLLLLVSSIIWIPGGILFIILPRILVSIYTFCRYRGKVRLLSGPAAFWSGGDDFYAFLHVIQGNCDIDKIRCLFDNVVNKRTEGGQLVYERLTQRISKRCGYFCSEAMEKFDMKEHIKFFSQKSLNFPIKQEEIVSELERSFNNPLPNDKPQWEVLVVPRFVYRKNESVHTPSSGRVETNENNNDNYYALLFRIHSSTLDKISAFNLFQNDLADNPAKLSFDPNNPPQSQIRVYSSGLIQWFKIIVAVVLWAPAWWLKNALRLVKNPLKTVKETEVTASTPRQNSASSSAKVLEWSRQINIKALNDIKRKTQTSVNSILMSCIATCFRSLVSGQNLPVPNELHASHWLAISPCPNCKSSANKPTCIVSTLYTNLDLPVRRLHAAFYSSKQSTLSTAEALGNYLFICIAGILPAYAVTAIYRNFHNVNVLVENLPGPVEAYRIFGGDVITDIYGWSSTKGTNAGVAITMVSYNGRLRVNMIGDTSFFQCPSHVSTLTREFEEELLKLAELCDIYRKEIFQTQQLSQEVHAGNPST